MFFVFYSSSKISELKQLIFRTVSTKIFKMVSSETRPPVLICILIVAQVISCQSAVYSPSGGPVYNGNAAAEEVVQPTPVANQFVTQTVYGFLDFTTTIGNTVMIFSPQSAAPPEPVKQTIHMVMTTVIETKPPPTVAATVVKPEIKPTKTITNNNEKPIVSSVVHVVAGQPPAPVVNTIVNVVKPTPKPKVQIISSKVEVVSEAPKKPKTQNTPKSAPPTQEIHSIVEIKQDKPSSVVQTQVNVAPTKIIDSEPIIYSSIVEIQASENDHVIDDEQEEQEREDDDNNEQEDNEEQHEEQEQQEVQQVDDEPVIQIGNNIGEPEYDFLSRQPAEFVEETYRVVNLRPNGNKYAPKPRPAPEARKLQTNSAHVNNNNKKKGDAHPTGLVTKLGGTVVKDGVTTVHETSVIGTYISGKYAQVLQSTSQIFQANSKPKITPTPSLRILKTAPPSIPKGNRNHHLEPTPSFQGHEETAALPVDAYANSKSPNLVRASRRPANPSGSFKNRFLNRGNKDEPAETAVPEVTEEIVHAVTPSAPHGGKKNGRRNGNKKNPEVVSVYSEPATPANKPNRRTTTKTSNNNNNSYRSNGFKPSNVTPANAEKRVFKAKPQPSPVDHDPASTSLYKFKLNRTPGRWQYKTTAKPRISIRKQNGELETPTGQVVSPLSENGLQNEIQAINSRQDDVDLEPSSSINGNILNNVDESENGIEKEKKLLVETLKVEISTPADFKDTYYEIATIKSPYTFQVGTVKNTRFVTVTSTIEKVFEPEPTITPSLTEPLTENILATTAHIDKEHNLLDSSIATLPVLTLSADMETPPLETLTETFSTTQLMLKTHILPVVRPGNNATSYTLIQTYHVTRLVTATKTLPPMELYQFVPSKRLNEFNSRLDEAGSELHLELEFGDDDEDDEDNPRQTLPSDLDLSNIGSDFDVSEVDKANLPEGLKRPKKKVSRPRTTESPILQQPGLNPEQLQQLALLRLLNPQAAAQIPQIITTSKPIVTLETVYESHIIPILHGASTSYSTISRPIGTVSKTEFEYGTSTLPVQLPQVPLNPFLQQQPQLQQQQQYQLQSTPVVTQLIVTATESKVLKLTFGAKTAYTTLFSTRVVPTQVTTYITNSVPVQPTANPFQGYFPSPYAPFPYVG
jgi:hypothetical protein